MLNENLYIEIILLLGLIASGIVLWFAMSIHFTILKFAKNSQTILKSYEEYRRSIENQILQVEIESQENTFEYISKEIHDNILQNISLVVINLNCIANEKKEESPETLTTSISQLKKVLEDLNNLSKSLDSDLIETHGLVSACQFECERWNRLYDITIFLETEGEIRHLDKNIELFLFRIIQESLSNSIKYSHASKIKVTIGYGEKSLTISVEDNGIGFDLHKILENKEIGKRSGIKNMKQRAQMISGTFELVTSPHNGTKVFVQINLDSYEKKLIGLVDDHKLLRSALAAMINSLGSYEVVMEASNGVQMLEKLKSVTPDIILLDFNMPEMNGLEAAERLKTEYPGINVLMLTMFDTELMLIKLLQAGVKGFMKKDIHPSDLKTALDSIIREGYYYSSQTSSKLAGFFRESDRHPVWNKILNEQEMTLMRLSSTELTYKEIALEMGLNPRTVDSIRDSLFEKLDVKSRVGLAMYAIKHGLVSI